jgi:hypothetical protein
VHEGATLKKGDRMGSFGYGGSSIVLAFEPNLDLQFGVVETKDGKSYTSEVSGPDTPTLMQIQQCLGKHTKRLDWLN